MQNDITFGANLVPLKVNPFRWEFVFHPSYRFMNSPLLAQRQDRAFRKINRRCGFFALEWCIHGLVPNEIFFQDVESFTHFSTSWIFLI
jgi:hypothetical protein